ncbi:MAG: TVP38/TMEM64 family protein [Bythopirellula sp.]
MPGQGWKKILLLGLLALAFGSITWKFGDLLSLDYLSTREEALRSYQQLHPWLSFFLAFVIYVTVTGLSIPGATALTLLYGWFFGLLVGVVLVSFASTSGATVAFLVSRYLFRKPIQEKFGHRLQQFNDALEREGPFYLFTLRLIPAIPFFVINVVMGLTGLRTSTYWWISQLGMLPATIVYVYAGASVPTLTELAEQGTRGILSVHLVAAFVAIGLFPFLVRLLLNKLGLLKNQESLAHD